MANTSTGTTLLNGLSSFWLSLFADKATLQSLYAASSEQLGQSYLDTLEAVLGPALNTVPVYHREYWSLVTLREDLTSFDPVAGTYTVKLPNNIASLNLLNNTVFSPAVILENTVDFNVVPGIFDGHNLSSSAASIVFNANPFVLNGVPFNYINIIPTVHQTGTDAVVTSSSNILTSASADFTSWNVGDNVVLDSFTQSGTYIVLAVNSATSVTLNNTFMTAENHLGWTLQSPSQVKEISFWAADALIDKFTLANAYGSLVGQIQPSTENYRAFLQAIFQYFILGAALERIEAVLNVAIGVPVIQTDGETVVSLSSSTVVTDANTYTIPVGSLRPDLTVGEILPAFTPLTTIFSVVDQVADPNWWQNIVIPSSMAPNETAIRRQVLPDLFANTYDNPTGLIRYGDPGFYYSADDTGYVPTGRVGLRHNYAYSLMDSYLQTNTFGIFVNQSYLPSDFSTSIMFGIIIEGKPAYLFCYAQAIQPLSDQLNFTDALTNPVSPDTSEDFPNVPNNMSYSSGFIYGEYYYYNPCSPTYISTGVGTPDMSIGQTPITFGGADPTAVTVGTNSYVDLPI